MIRINVKNNKGFVILFAVTISAIVLSLALGVANIAFKEIMFGTSAKDTNEAFFAADTGIECALTNDKLTGSIFVGSGNPSFVCNNTNITASQSPASYWSFVVSGLNNSGQGCAKVTIDKTASSVVTIISKGYNKGGEVSGLCTIGLNSIEREIKVSYGGGSALPPPPPPPTWYATGGIWNYRKAITIDHTKVPNTNQTNFPVLIDITDAGLQANAKTDGYDILFTSDDKLTKLSHEREVYTTGTGALTAWVKIPTLSTTVDTVIYMYYGNASAGDQADPTNVWDANYLGVWHFGTTSSLSVVNSKTGTSSTNSGVTVTTGKIGGAANFVDSGDILTTEVTDKINTLTFEAWAYASSGTAWGCMVCKRGAADTASEHAWRRHYNTSSNNENQYTGMFTTTTPTWYSGDGISFPLSTTMQWVYAWNGSSASNNPIFYKNGAVGGFTEYTSPVGSKSYLADGTPFTIGNRQALAQHFAGWLDEVRISNIVRSADWVKTGYNNQNSPATFYKSIGVQETP